MASSSSESTATCGVISFCSPGYCSYVIWAAARGFDAGELEPHHGAGEEPRVDVDRFAASSRSAVRTW